MTLYLMSNALSKVFGLQPSRRERTVKFSEGVGHLLLDQVWQTLPTLFWPLYGWRFPRGTTLFDEWVRFHLSVEGMDPVEWIGAALLLWFAIQLCRHRSVLRFLRTGAVG